MISPRNKSKIAKNEVVNIDQSKWMLNFKNNKPNKAYKDHLIIIALLKNFSARTAKPTDINTWVVINVIAAPNILYFGMSIKFIKRLINTPKKTTLLSCEILCLARISQPHTYTNEIGKLEKTKSVKTIACFGFRTPCKLG